LKIGYIIGAFLLAGFVILGITSFRDTLTPYVGIEEARVSQTPVQVAGDLVHDSIAFDEEGRLCFSIRDESGAVMDVRFSKAKPSGLEEADQVVVAGTMDGEIFVAEQVLVKCPSKYEGKTSS
jgi:cytochrome c-type biogenesis protein CcmE